MNGIILEVFRHGAWSTKVLVSACRDLSSEQLTLPVRGFGSILATLNHVVQCDAQYVTTLTGSGPAWVADEIDTDDLDQIEQRVDETLDHWERFLVAPGDPDRLLSLDAGEYECRASVVVAQAVHHGNVHREQIRAALKDLVEPPDVQAWEYALATGRARRPEKE